jgi:RNA polymerase sigma-70 factor (ECF subfamily)
MAQMDTRSPILTAEVRDAALHAALRSDADVHARIARRLLGNDADADDALGAAWLRVWRARDAWRGEGPPGAWVRAIVVRECLRTLRWRTVRRWLPFVSIEDATEAVPSSTSTADVALDAARVRAFVTLLPSKQRVAFTLRFDEGWTIAEVAEAMNLSPETVKTHLARALDRVRAHLGAHA